jgi:hypothetical protein
MPKRRRMMGVITKLSPELIDLGFFSVLGTSEHLGNRDEESYVKHGEAYTYDYNNGVTVVYDEEGRPWIIPENCYRKHWKNLREEIDYSETAKEFGELRFMYNLQHGAYVPHSNDGGRFVQEVIPSL